MVMASLSARLTDLLASLFPVITARGRLRILEVRSDGEELRALVRLEVLDADQVTSAMEQEVSLGASSGDDLASTAARVRQRLTTDPLEGNFPSHFTRPSTPFQRIPKSPSSDDDTILWQLRDQVRTQAHALGFEDRFEVMSDWPQEACTLYFLDLADAMLGGNGLEVFLDQACAEEVVGVLSALDAAGCTTLVQLYREGLSIIAKRGRALDDLDEQWLSREKRKPRARAWRSWQALDSHEEGGTYALLKSELTPKLAAFVAHHRAVLQDE